MTRSSIGAVLLVGGLGTRLRPLTLHRPKALMPVLNKPFLSYQFDLLKKAGVSHVALAANPKFKKWKKDLLRIVPKGIKLHFAFEPEPLGTGGAIRFGYDYLLKSSRQTFETVIVFNGDVLFEINLNSLVHYHRKRKSDGTIALTPVSDISRYGVVLSDSSGRIKAFKEKPKGQHKPGHINAGVYVMERAFLEKIPSGRALSVERDFFPGQLKLKSRMYSLVISGYWNDIGTPASYLQAHGDLLRKRNLCIGKQSKLGRRVERRGFVCLGSHVSVADNCLIENSVFFDRVKLEKGVQARGVVLGQGCRIGQYSILSPGTIFGDNTNIPAFTRT